MPASLKLILTDAAGNPLSDFVTIDLFAQQSSQHFQTSRRIKGEIVIDGIDVSAGPFYRVMITPANHRIIQFFIGLRDGKTVSNKSAVPVDPQKVVSLSAPAFKDLPTQARDIMNAAEVPKFNGLQGPKLYSTLDTYPLLKGCFLNITAKSAATKLQTGESCLDHYLGLVRVEQDRLFIRTTAALVEEAAHSNSFHEVSPALHDPLPGYNMLQSFKTFDHYGNLQLTFQRRGDTGNDYAVDVDIDDAQGIEHIFQVVRNSINGPTNPYDIHDILLQQQPKVDPGYDFVFAASLAAH
jgi:hypothetical protein